MKTYIYIFTGILLLLITICPILYHIENKVFNPLQSQELRKIFLSYEKIKKNLSKNITDEKLKKLFNDFLDKLRNEFKNQNLNSYDISFFNKIILPLTKRVYYLGDINDES